MGFDRVPHSARTPATTMLKWIRDARIDFKTGVVLIAITVLVWIAVVYLNLGDVGSGFAEPSGNP